MGMWLTDWLINMHRRLIQICRRLRPRGVIRPRLLRREGQGHAGREVRGRSQDQLRGVLWGRTKDEESDWCMHRSPTVSISDRSSAVQNGNRTRQWTVELSRHYKDGFPFPKVSKATRRTNTVRRLFRGCFLNLGIFNVLHFPEWDYIIWSASSVSSLGCQNDKTPQTTLLVTRGSVKREA